MPLPQDTRQIVHMFPQIAEHIPLLKHVHTQGNDPQPPTTVILALSKHPARLRLPTCCKRSKARVGNFSGIPQAFSNTALDVSM
jgi:hypothetical protein